jgi:hypothetical protein
MKDLSRDIQLASTGSEEELQYLVHHPSSKVIERLLLNPHLTEALVLVIAGRKNIETGILESIYQDKRWRDSYRILLALCKNPKTPQKITLSLLKSLRIFDLADLTRNQQIPINIRMKAEAHIIEKILTMPLGIKITLARRASSNILMKLLEDGMKEVVAVCLDSPQMTEGDICRILHMKKIASHVIRQISNHPKWSSRYDVQWALIRNNNTPLSRTVDFLKKMKTTDLKELYAAPEVPISTRPFIYREIIDREEIRSNSTH